MLLIDRLLKLTYSIQIRFIDSSHFYFGSDKRVKWSKRCDVAKKVRLFINGDRVYMISLKISLILWQFTKQHFLCKHLDGAIISFVFYTFILKQCKLSGCNQKNKNWDAFFCRSFLLLQLKLGLAVICTLISNLIKSYHCVFLSLLSSQFPILILGLHLNCAI